MTTSNHLTVRDVMHPGIVSCAVDADAADMARMMAARSVHCIAVVSVAEDAGGAPRVWGIASDLDVLSALTRRGGKATAADLAGEPVITVRPGLGLREAAAAMVRYGVHHVVVADPERHTPVGVLSTLDVIRTLADGPRSKTAHRTPSDRTAEIHSMLRASRNP